MPTAIHRALWDEVQSPLFWDDGRVVLLDQRRLPLEEVWLAYDDADGVAGAIREMVVRGAPAIGCAAAMGLAASARSALPELPLRRRRRFVEELELSEYDAAELTRERELADYFEQAVAAGAQPKRAANWMLTELLSRVADARAVTSAPVTPAALAELLGLVASGAVSGKLAKEIWPRMWMTGRSAREIAEADNLFQQSDTSAIECVVRGILEANAEKVADYRAGKTKLYGFFVGQVMQATKGKANPQLVNDLLKRALEG